MGHASLNVNVGSLIRRERQHQGLSLRELARRVGVSASMLSQVETGRTRPSVSTIYAIATELGLSIDALLSDREAAVATATAAAAGGTAANGAAGGGRRRPRPRRRQAGPPRAGPRRPVPGCAAGRWAPRPPPIWPASWSGRN